jgi:hypothetical protein
LELEGFLNFQIEFSWRKRARIVKNSSSDTNKTSTFFEASYPLSFYCFFSKKSSVLRKKYAFFFAIDACGRNGQIFVSFAYLSGKIFLYYSFN